MTIMVGAEMRMRLFQGAEENKVKGIVAWENNWVISKPMGHLCAIGLLWLSCCILLHKLL